MNISKEITKEELRKMGFSRLAIEFMYSRRGKDFEEILVEVYSLHRIVPFAIRQNIQFIAICNNITSYNR